MKYELQIADRGIEKLKVDLVTFSDDGKEISRKQIDLGGNATHAAYWGAAMVVQALNDEK